jgi:hypothetical protein
MVAKERRWTSSAGLPSLDENKKARHEKLVCSHTWRWGLANVLRALLATIVLAAAGACSCDADVRTGEPDAESPFIDAAPRDVAHECVLDRSMRFLEPGDDVVRVSSVDYAPARAGNLLMSWQLTSLGNTAELARVDSWTTSSFEALPLPATVEHPSLLLAVPSGNVILGQTEGGVFQWAEHDGARVVRSESSPTGSDTQVQFRACEGEPVAVGLAMRADDAAVGVMVMRWSDGAPRFSAPYFPADGAFGVWFVRGADYPLPEIRGCLVQDGIVHVLVTRGGPPGPAALARFSSLRPVDARAVGSDVAVDGALFVHDSRPAVALLDEDVTLRIVGTDDGFGRLATNELALDVSTAGILGAFSLRGARVIVIGAGTLLAVVPWSEAGTLGTPIVVADAACRAAAYPIDEGARIRIPLACGVHGIGLLEMCP